MAVNVADAVISWLGGARVGLSGLSPVEVRRLAGRWCAEVEAVESVHGGELLSLEVPPVPKSLTAIAPRRVMLGAHLGSAGEPAEIRVGAHAVVLGTGAEPDVVRFSRRRPPSPIELDLLIDCGIGHVLARQGLACFHGCGFELGGTGVFGLGDSFSGKTTVSVAAMRAGGRVVSDDAVLLAPTSGGELAIAPTRSFGWLRGRTVEIATDELRDKMQSGQENGQPRWVLRREDGGEGFVDRAIPNVIWVQSVDRRLKQSRIEAIDQSQVFAALIRASSPLFLSRHCPEIRDRLIPVFQRLCSQCRGYRVRLAPRLLEAPVDEMRRLVDLSSEL
ncbi:MAG: hypothetical protein V2I67_15650 [Thermoanaerobaculales bacterium]|jgi:hypothetical protein|nr:hypothetical protein [Thermoanaerobaculales bacterium]